MTELVAPVLHLSHLRPELLLFSMSLFLMAVAIVRPSIDRKIIGFAVMAFFAISAVLVVYSPYSTVYGDLFISEYSSQFFKLAVLLTGFAAAAVKIYEKAENSRNTIFQFALLMLSITAMMFLTMAGSLVTIFASLELCTLPILVMVAIQNSEDPKAAPRYLLITILSALLVLFGFGFLFGLSGNSNLLQMKLQIAIVHLTRREIGVIILLSVAAILTGLMLKASLPPFHKWSRAIYRSMPVSILMLIAVAVPIIVLAAFAKIFINGLFAFHGPEMSPNDWGRIVAFIAFTSLVFGTIQMVRQKGFMSFLYYANFVQIGFILTGMISMNPQGLQSSAFYIASYVFSMAGLFAMSHFLKSVSNDLEMTKFAGLYHSSKNASILTGILLMSLAGLPITAGFMAKYTVIEAAFDLGTADRAFHWMFLLTAAAAICAAVGFLKLSQITLSLFKKSESEHSQLRIPAPILGLLIIVVLGTLLLGILPNPVLAYLSKISQAFGFITE